MDYQPVLDNSDITFHKRITAGSKFINLDYEDLDFIVSSCAIIYLWVNAFIYYCCFEH